MAQESIDSIASAVVAGLKARLGTDAWSRFTIEDRTLIAECATDAADLLLLSLVPPMTEAEERARLQDRRGLDAQLANIEEAGKADVRNAFWSVIAESIDGAKKLLIAAIV